MTLREWLDEVRFTNGFVWGTILVMASRWAPWLLLASIMCVLGLALIIRDIIETLR